ncbi:EamA/RhaT family transporter [Candidatus Bathyarchaeota archaeon]|nr:MAG: EamA/RhaT family transporter [Candidatus Bathyarchaeota archaeon]
MQGPSKLRLYLRLSIIFGVILFSISSSSILILLSGATATSCAFWRVFIASIILASTWLIRNGLSTLHLDRETVLYSVLSGLSLAVHFLLWMKSLFMVPVSISTTVVVTYPLFAVLIDSLVLHEHVKPIQVAGLILGFIGVLLFMQPWVLGCYNSLGVLLSLGGAVAASFYFTMGRVVRRRTDLLSYTILAYTTASTALLLYAAIHGENIIYYPPRTYVYFILLTLIPMMGGHTLINYILRYVKTGVATSIALGEPVGASILAHITLSQVVDPPKALVMVLVLSSIALTISSEAGSTAWRDYNDGR